MIGKRKFQRIGFTMPAYYIRDTEIINSILTLQVGMSEHVQICGMYLAYNNPPSSISKAKNERQLPTGKNITEEQFNESDRFIELVGTKLDDLYSSLSRIGKIRINNEELIRKERNRFTRR